MRFMVVGDLQLLCNDMHSPRSEQTRNTLSWILQTIEQTRPQVFVHLGDFGESNEGVDHYSLSLMTWFMQGVFHRVPRSYWLTGNHDFFTEDGSINLMTALSPLMPANHVAVWPWEPRGPENTMFVSYLAPGSRERWRADAGLVFAERAQSVLFSHLPINGAMYSPGVHESKGLDANNFPAWTIVGHYHKPNPPSQVQQCFGTAIFYAGSPMSHDFRDNCYGLTKEQQLRGIWSFEIEQGKVVRFPEFHENPHAQYFVSFTSDIVNGQIVDPWFNQQCVLPESRTTLRVTAPPGNEQAFENLSRQFLKVQSLVPAAAPTAGVVNIDPNVVPEYAVVEYVKGLSADKLKGLDPQRLSQVGSALVGGQYQVPAVQNPYGVK